MLHDFLLLLGFLILLFGIITLGFLIVPRPFRAHPAPSQAGEPAPFLPELPAPVRAHFAETIGENPQRIQTAVIWGRGRACIRGVWVPLRFKGWYRPGEAFYRRIEVTWFMRPVLRGSESYLEERGSYALGGRPERGERTDESELLELWTSAIWFPSYYVHDPRARWEPVDEVTARLVVPFGAGSETVLAHFDPLSRRMTHLTTRRYSSDAPEKEPWRVDLLAWQTYHGLLLPSQISVAWGESGSPWSYWNIDGVTFNVNVADQLG
ncbi:MAG TPA: DUF6544 family protein [Anaerolineaceae bacterium]